MVDDSIEPGKGRPTPSRRDAEAARKKRMTVPVNKREQAKAQRRRRIDSRTKMRVAMQTGDEQNLPKRERGPVRAFCRDFIDRRWNYAEFLLPLLLLILVLSFFPQPWAAPTVFAIWSATIIGVIFDESIMIWALRKQLKERFPDVSTRGSVGYSILRSTQLRRIRLPKPQIKRGAPLKPRY